MKLNPFLKAYNGDYPQQNGCKARPTLGQDGIAIREGIKKVHPAWGEPYSLFYSAVCRDLASTGTL